MTSLRITYLILTVVIDIFYVGLAVAAPIWITPGYYWWTAFGLIMLIGVSMSFTARVNSWVILGQVK